MPGEAIVGYLTRDHGVTIHRRACSFIVRLPESRHNRILSAHWGNNQNIRTDVDIEVEAYDRQGLLRDISDLFAREKVNAVKANTMSRNNLALMQFSIEISSLEQLSRLLALIQHVPSVIAARRRD
jgi:GTP pyrophosphokinase